MIVRREAQRIQRYVHLATGNYNDRTARLYSDIGLMTCDREIAADVAAFFNLLTGYSEAVGWSKLAVAPIGLRQKFIDLIDREIQVSTARPAGPDHGQDQLAARPGDLPRPVPRQPGGRQGDAERPRHLLSAAGHRRRLREHRGPLDRRPLPGTRPASSTSATAGTKRCISSSADWMQRNLSKRLELLFPVIDPEHRRRLIEALETYFADNVKAWRLRSDGTYEKVARKRPRRPAQTELYKDSVDAVRDAAHAMPASAR